MKKPTLQIAQARYLRRNKTDAESLLWRHLSAKKVAGLKFRRQQPIGPYIVDFVCFDKQLVIEVDGSQHLYTTERLHDDKRSA